MVASVETHESETYDPSLLFQHYVRARRVMQSRRGMQRYSAAASELCSFFAVLADDVMFWDIARRMADDPPGDLLEIFGSLDEWLDVEHELLERAGLDADVAANIVEQLGVALMHYRSGSEIAVDTIRARIDAVAHEICSVEATRFDEPESRRRVHRLINRGLRISAGVVGVAADIVVPNPATPFSIVGGLLVAGADIHAEVTDQE